MCGNWYHGTIKDFNATEESHLVVYTDGDTRWHNIGEDEANNILRWTEPRASTAKPKVSAAASSKPKAAAASKPKAAAASKPKAVAASKSTAKRSDPAPKTGAAPKQRVKSAAVKKAPAHALSAGAEMF